MKQDFSNTTEVSIEDIDAAIAANEDNEYNADVCEFHPESMWSNVGGNDADWQICKID